LNSIVIPDFRSTDSKMAGHHRTHYRLPFRQNTKITICVAAVDGQFDQVPVRVIIFRIVETIWTASASKAV